jgi:ribonuclease BN (tRNA processing enzyme)
MRLTVLGGCGAWPAAGVGQLVLTHLMPGADPDDAVLAAAEGYAGPIAVASPGLMAEADR